MLVTTSVKAGIQLNGTRVVYPANEREVSLGLVNDGTEARLVQSWVDSGDVRERPEDSKAPFIITPPMTRVDPGKGQTLRIIFSGTTMPQDRESVFWLNILEILQNLPKNIMTKVKTMSRWQYDRGLRFSIGHKIYLIIQTWQ
jgi:P pilus assembly chaperone PapD